MQLPNRDWRVVACHRGLPDCVNRNEFQQCLIEQMTESEFRVFKRERFIFWAALIGSVVLPVAFGVGPLMLFISPAVLIYLNPDPVNKALREYSEERAAEVRAVNLKERQRRVAEGR